MSKLFCTITIIFSFLITILSIVACTKEYESFYKLGSSYPSFSEDTINVDTLYSGFRSATKRLVVYNYDRKAICFSEIYLKNKFAKNFKTNIDGHSSIKLKNVILLPKDSMSIFIEGFFHESNSKIIEKLTDSLCFKLSKTEEERYVTLLGFRQNIYNLNNSILQKDTIFPSDKPIYIKDSLVITPNTTLTIQAGSHIIMGARAFIRVYGKFMCKGEPQNRIYIEQVRKDNILPDISYQQIPGNWGGIFFEKSSIGNILHYTSIRNGNMGIQCKEYIQKDINRIEMNACVISNMKSNTLFCKGGTIKLLNCEFSNSQGSCIETYACNLHINSCTIANFYPWDIRFGPAMKYSNYLEDNKQKNIFSNELYIINSIIDGNASINNKYGELTLQIAQKEKMKIHISDSYIKANKSDTLNFENCFWYNPKIIPDSCYISLGFDKEKNKENFIYNFRLKKNSPFKNKISHLTTDIDLDGRARSIPTSFGAYK